MIIKEMIGDLLAQLAETDDPVARMEIIDTAEVLNTEIPEAGEGGEDFEQKYNDLLTKFKERFTGELRGNADVVDDEVDEVEQEEDENPDFNEMTFEEAGFTGIEKMRGDK